ncbi:hypothetical protein BRAS3843_3040042 [Bradyrhizobium sp. STM 3843]|nr:hypothetical protein BRAS3843_3040042 [Bradyrhizobium sp. STM 3843]
MRIVAKAFGASGSASVSSKYLLIEKSLQDFAISQPIKLNASSRDLSKEVVADPARR